MEYQRYDMSTRGENNRGGRGGYGKHNYNDRKQQPKQEVSPYLTTKNQSINLISKEGVEVTAERCSWWPITMSVYDRRDYKSSVQTNWSERAIRRVKLVFDKYNYDREQSHRPYTAGELADLIDIVGGIVGVKAYENTVFDGIRIEDALKTLQPTGNQVEILSRSPITSMDDRAKFIIPTGKYVLIDSATNYNAYNEAFYVELIKMGGLQKDSDAWRNLKIRTGFGYELFLSIVTAGANEIFTGHTKKLLEIVMEWPSSALKLMDVTLPKWTPTDVPRGDHPTFRMVGILNITQSNLEKYALLQELHDDFHVTLPLAMFRSHFRSILHGYGIDLRLYNGSRDPYPIEMAFLYNMDGVMTSTQFKHAILESRKLVMDQVLTSELHVDNGQVDSTPSSSSDKDVDRESENRARDVLCLYVSKRVMEDFKNLRVVESHIMYSTRCDNPFVIFNAPYTRNLLTAMMISDKAPTADNPSLVAVDVKDETPVAESLGTTSEPVAESSGATGKTSSSSS